MEKYNIVRANLENSADAHRYENVYDLLGGTK